MMQKPERALRELWSDARWIRLPKPLLLVMKEAEAILLSYLINWSFCAGRPENKGWFYCPMKYIHFELNMVRSKQTELIKRLRLRGYLKMAMRGNPAKRWLWIDYDRLWRDLEKVIDKQNSDQEMVRTVKGGYKPWKSWLRLGMPKKEE